jgi:hypothetical protein
MKLNIFTATEERSMMGGTMVRLVPTNADQRVALARLGISLNFRLVTFDDRQLFMFDNVTKNRKAHPLAWMALGAGFAVYVAFDWLDRF